MRHTGGAQLNVWVDIGATSVVLLLAALLLGAMFIFIKAASDDDSGKYKMLREMVETIFGTPAHLRSGGGQEAANQAVEANGKAKVPAQTAAFREPCPACGAEVTEKDDVCPSCELRLL
ncbi:hypothetical protein D3P08_01360 [Paenibacillus nanensis]|uniref:Uncharacterized protein n=1 Tax=Paenibacillus nanensis TaxID=393251 RepID=A0A3A1VKI2_9BACL|nr:hypothetical protein D3P08_01360 [Paenibacillus nanensis]